MQQQTERAEIRESVSGGEAPALARIWKCPACGAQIQIVVAPANPSGPFICMCGTPMVAGEEH